MHQEQQGTCLETNLAYTENRTVPLPALRKNINHRQTLHDAIPANRSFTQEENVSHSLSLP